MRILLSLLLLAAAASAQPQRIVSTVPGLTEILYALGLGDRIAGVSEYCQYPAAARQKPRVGSFLQPNLERIASLRPDVVYIIRNPVRLKARLEALHLRVEEVDLESIDGILAAITTLGQQNGKTREAAALRQSLTQRLAKVRAQAKQRYRTVFLVGRTPQRLEGMIAVGPGSYLDTLLAAAGGDNILRDAANMYPKVSIETLLARQPEVIFEMGDAVHEGIPGSQYREDVLRVWAKLPGLTAVRQQRVYPLNDSVFVVPGPRFAEAAEKLQAMLSGKAP